MNPRVHAHMRAYLGLFDCKNESDIPDDDSLMRTGTHADKQLSGQHSLENNALHTYLLDMHTYIRAQV